MASINEIKDTLNIEEHDLKKLPSNLNTLTILTYIGCALGFIGSLYSYFTICKSVEVMKNNDVELGGAFGNMIENAMLMAEKQCENRLVMLIITILFVGLCAWGAMQMRNLKKQGLLIYAIGELGLPIATVLVLGAGAMSGMVLITGLIVPVVMLILYATQRKFLVN